MKAFGELPGLGLSNERRGSVDLSKLQPGYRPIPGKPYELIEELGQGGFGVVWKARNENLNEMFVFKFCHDPQDAKTLHNERRFVTALKHPDIVRLHDEYLDLSTPYAPCLIYEFVDGVDLDEMLTERVESNQALSPEEATGLILKIAKIVASLHSHPNKIVHRDLKPQNILVANYHDLLLLKALGAKPDLRLAKLKLMDFGIGSRSSLGRNFRSMAQSIGRALDGGHTPNYASPQQIDGEPAAECDDVYALGAMWYQFLLGDVPGGTGWQRVLLKKGLTNHQIKVLEKCLEKERENRIPNASVLVKNIRATMPKAVLKESFKEHVTRACSAHKRYVKINVKTLTLEGARAMVEFGNRVDRVDLNLLQLLFPNLNSVTPDVVKKLSEWGGGVGLSGLTTLTLEIADILVNSGEFFPEFDHLGEVSIDVAEKLAGWDDRDLLSLNGLMSLSAPIAEKLATFKGYELQLNGIQSLTPGVAKKLAEFQGDCLTLDGIKTLTQEDAEELATWNGYELSLNGITNLDAKIAKKLAGFQGDCLKLDGIKTLTQEVAEELATWDGEELSLEGLNAEAAEIFENHRRKS